MIETLAVVLPQSEAYGRGITIVAVSLVFILVASAAAFVVVRMVSRSITEGSSSFTKDQAMRKRAELLALAKKRKADAQRAQEMVEPLDMPTQEGVDVQSSRREAQEAAREALRTAAGSAVGISCPHCQIAMAPDEDLVVCPICLTVQHRVCFDLSGCAEGCKADYVYEHPAERFRELGRSRG
ncbi:MAG: hypothetical protein A2Y63_03230 [Candidatus Riflebacteria bacterium RBG_13_59_9]|nr:MAG: hypothetical protein A2Y63_03230 [Candidatus Riflebacteria bacterium RBG_13_59_9]